MYLCDSSKTYINFQQSRLFSTAPISRRKFAILSSLSLRSSCNLGLNSDKSDEPFLIASFISVSNFSSLSSSAIFRSSYLRAVPISSKRWMLEMISSISSSRLISSSRFIFSFFITTSPLSSALLSCFSKCGGLLSRSMGKRGLSFDLPFSGFG